MCYIQINEYACGCRLAGEIALCEEYNPQHNNCRDRATAQNVTRYMRDECPECKSIRLQKERAAYRKEKGDNYYYKQFYG